MNAVTTGAYLLQSNEQQLKISTWLILSVGLIMQVICVWPD